MRILFLADAGTYHTQRWVNYFVGRGHRCSLITLDPGLPTRAEEFIIGMNVLPDFLRYPLSAIRAKSLMELIKPDLVNAHFVPSYGLVGALTKFHPLVVSTWGSDVLISPRKSWLHTKRGQYVLSRADLVTADAKVTARAVCDLGVDEEKVAVSPMGIERALLDQSEKKGKNQVLILSNRKLEPLYDVATLLRAIPPVMEQSRRELRLVILGEGSQKSRLLDLAIKLGIEAHLDFKGLVSREVLLELYRESDIYVSTATSDSTSVSLLEAMNFGLIPIVTDIPGNREWIHDGSNGLLFSVSNPQALAERILYAIDHGEATKGFREINREIIRSRAVWEDNMGVIEEHFKALAPASA